MTAKLKTPLCDNCKNSSAPGFIEIDGKLLGKCPCRFVSVTAEEAKVAAMKSVALGHAASMQVAVEVITAHAQHHATLSSNDTREALTAAGIDGPVVGAAFARAVRLKVIEPLSFVPSTDPGTKGHHVRSYRSLVAENFSVGTGAA